MIRIGTSQSTSPNKELVKLDRVAGEDNIAWMQRALDCIRNDEKHSLALLVGGTDTASFRLRTAQSQARMDLTPSSWSHIALIERNKSAQADALVVHEISLIPDRGFGFPPVNNALQKSRMGVYADAAVYPNIALLSLPAQPDNVEKALARFAMQRSSLDVVELLVAWLAYVWGVSSATNPLLSGLGMPSASMVEAVVSYAGFEMTPGMPSRSSCPEAVWQSALWWHDYYKDQKRTPITGCWNIEHWYVPE